MREQDPLKLRELFRIFAENLSVEPEVEIFAILHNVEKTSVFQFPDMVRQGRGADVLHIEEDVAGLWLLPGTDFFQNLNPSGLRQRSRNLIELPF